MNEPTYDDLKDAFRGRLLTFHNEKKLHFEIANALTQAGIPFVHEYILDHKSRIDFVIADKICLEVKTKKTSKTDVFRQVGRYLDSGKFSLGIILTTKAIQPLITEWKLEDGRKIPIRMIDVWIDTLQ